MQTLALLFLAVGVANLVFAQRPGGTRWNVVMGVVSVFAGGALAVAGDDGAPVIFAAVPGLLFASFMHSRARAAASDESDEFDPPV